ncbi:MAG: lytic transglycosylase domain-containing protein [Bacilli bacterium]
MGSAAATAPVAPSALTGLTGGASTQQQADALLAQLLQSELESSLGAWQTGSTQSSSASGFMSNPLTGGLTSSSTQDTAVLMAMLTAQLTGGASASSGAAASSSAVASSGSLTASAAAAAVSALNASAIGNGTTVNGGPFVQNGNFAQTLLPLIDKLAPQYGLSPSLVAAVIQQESGFQPNATSSSGAMGLMQLMPATASMLGVANPYDPLANMQGGMKYLSGLLTHYHGNLALALAAYNAGPAAVAQYGGIPPFAQTQNYVADIMSRLGLQP